MRKNHSYDVFAELEYNTLYLCGTLLSYFIYCIVVPVKLRLGPFSFTERQSGILLMFWVFLYYLANFWIVKEKQGTKMNLLADILLPFESFTLLLYYRDKTICIRSIIIVTLIAVISYAANFCIIYKEYLWCEQQKKKMWLWILRVEKVIVFIMLLLSVLLFFPVSGESSLNLNFGKDQENKMGEVRKSVIEVKEEAVHLLGEEAMMNLESEIKTEIMV